MRCAVTDHPRHPTVHHKERFGIHLHCSQANAGCRHRLKHIADQLLKTAVELRHRICGSIEYRLATLRFPLTP